MATQPSPDQSSYKTRYRRSGPTSCYAALARQLIQFTEEVQRQSIWLTDTEASMAPPLILQLMLNRQTSFNCTLVERLHLIHLDYHEPTLRRPIIPEVVGFGVAW